jgi:hypothetical protein
MLGAAVLERERVVENTRIFFVTCLFTIESSRVYCFACLQFEKVEESNRMFRLRHALI